MRGSGSRGPAAHRSASVTFRYFTTVAMSEALSLNRQFAVEMHSRAIDTCNDIEELRKVAKTLLSAWQMQADFSERFGAELLGLKRAGC